MPSGPARSNYRYSLSLTEFKNVNSCHVRCQMSENVIMTYDIFLTMSDCKWSCWVASFSMTQVQDPIGPMLSCTTTNTLSTHILWLHGRARVWKIWSIKKWFLASFYETDMTSDHTNSTTTQMIGTKTRLHNHHYYHYYLLHSYYYWSMGWHFIAGQSFSNVNLTCHIVENVRNLYANLTCHNYVILHMTYFWHMPDISGVNVTLLSSLCASQHNCTVQYVYLTAWLFLVRPFLIIYIELHTCSPVTWTFYMTFDMTFDTTFNTTFTVNAIMCHFLQLFM